MTHKDDPLDKILDDYAAGIVLEERTGISLHKCKYFIEAKAEILKHYILKSEVEAAIGEDEDTWVDLGEVENSKQDGRNELRAEIRAKLNIEG